MVGTGLSGVQLALRLSDEFPGKVLLAGHRKPEVHLFDSDREWQGKNRMEAFSRITDPVERRKVITRERHRGSVTPEIAKDLDLALGEERLSLLVTEITAARPAVSAFSGRAENHFPGNAESF